MHTHIVPFLVLLGDLNVAEGPAFPSFVIQYGVLSKTPVALVIVFFFFKF
jgi:hypothetical protein